MTSVMMFIADNPFIFLIIVLVIYLIVVRNMLIKKNKEIDKVYINLKEYMIFKLNQSEALLKRVVDMYPSEEKLVYQLNIVIRSISNSKKDDTLLTDASNNINNLVLNYESLNAGLLEKIGILKEIELFNKSNIKPELEEDRLIYNRLINEYNHDIINPINGFIAILFNLRGKSSLIESNEGKEPIKVVKNTIDIELSQNEISEDDDESVKKVCSNCGHEFKNTHMCPVCGSVVI